MFKRTVALLSTLALLISVLGACGPQQATEAPPTPTQAPAEPTETPTEEEAGTEEAQILTLATTTSTENSGLLGYLLPFFEEEYNAEIEVIAVGTGQALQIGEDGNADVLMVHARSLEDAFMDAGHGVRREDLMYNDFVIVGPPDDPAGIEGMTDAAAAFAQIAEAEATFISRGDESGTHTKEKAIWSGAGVEPSGDWYVSAGQGMGAVLTMADEQQAYTLSDRATYLARTLEGTDLVILVEGDPILFNPYGVIAVNPEKSPEINDELANQFIDWLISVPTQEKIAEFGVEEFGAPLFTPDSEPWREANPSAEAEDMSEGIPEDAALRLTGPAQNIGWTREDLEAMPTIDVEYTDKDGETTTYTGVPIHSLLELAGVSEGATLLLVADDGYAAEIDLGAVLGCDNCIVALEPDGSLRSVFPEQSGKVQVKGLIEIQVQL